MKLFKQFFTLFFVASILVLASCSDDKDDNPVNNNNDNNNSNSNTMTATISGSNTENFDAANVMFIVQSVGGMSQTVITGQNGNQTNGSQIMIQLIALELGPSVVDLSEMISGQVMYVTYKNGSVSQNVCNQGTVTISKNTTSEIQGTFNVSGGTASQGTDINMQGSFYCKK